MAEALAKHKATQLGVEKDFVFASAGTSTEELGNPPHHGTVRELERRGIDVRRHLAGKRARQLKSTEYDEWDYVLTMDQRNLRNLRPPFSTDVAGKVRPIMAYLGDVSREVADPWYTGDFATTYQDLDTALDAFFVDVTREGD